MGLKYLITGATGNLGGQVLRYFAENVPHSEFAAASSKASNRSIFESRGIAFRHVDYNDPESLDTGLRDVENLLFVSSSGGQRIEQHSSVINAAKRAGVKHVWYTSLAFGGFEDNSRFFIQAEHIQTERLLKESGLTYTSIREGAYAEAFPWYLDWQPERTKLLLSADGAVAFTLRADLGEATARIMIRGGYENQIVLFTAGETITPKEMVDIINETTGRQIQVEIVSREEYIRRSSAEEETRGKPKEHFQMVAAVWDEVAGGALSTTHPLMEEILGREPIKPRDALKLLLTENRDHIILSRLVDGFEVMREVLIILGTEVRIKQSDQHGAKFVSNPAFRAIALNEHPFPSFHSTTNSSCAASHYILTEE